jgi:hypothetical protein
MKKVDTSGQLWKRLHTLLSYGANLRLRPLTTGLASLPDAVRTFRLRIKSAEKDLCQLTISGDPKFS